MIILNRKDFLPALAAVINAVERRVNIPVLGNVLIVAEDNILHLTATNLDQQITAATTCQAEGRTAVTVPAALLHDAVRKLADDADIKIDVQENTISMSAGRTRFRFSTLPADDMPVMSQEDMPFTVTFMEDDFKALLTKVRYAISNEETRYYLNGIYLHTENADTLIAAATDGHQLARLHIAAEGSFADMPGVIVPRQFWDCAKNLFSHTDIINVSLSTNRILMQSGTTTLLSKLIDGKFPDYQRVIPQDCDKHYCLNRNALTAAINRVSTLASDRSRAIKFTFADGRLLLTATDPDRGSATDEIDLLPESSSEQFEVGFNGRYVLNVMTACSEESVILHANHINNAVLFTNVSEPESGQFVIMPMRV